MRHIAARSSSSVRLLVLIAGLLLAFAPSAQAATSLSVSPAGQDVGGTVTLGGSGFAANSVVTFTFDGSPLGTSPALVTTDGNGNFSGVTFTVPSGTAVGTHTVAATDALTDTANSTMQVDSLSVSPSAQSVGGTVTLSGSGFAANSAVTFTFDGAPLNTSPATTDSNGSFSSVTFSVPSATAGAHTIAATDAGNDTASTTVNVNSSISVTPNGQSDGGTVTVSGSGFAANSPVTFTFDGASLPTSSAMTDANGSFSGVTFSVPNTALNGSHTVSATDGSSNTASTPLEVDSLSSTPGGESDGGTVTVSGSGFAPNSPMTFTFDGSPVTTSPSSVTTDNSGNIPSGVTFSVPDAAPVGAHTVAATDGSNDTASSPLNVDSLSLNLSGQSPGGAVTLSGSGFAPGSAVTIRFDGTPVTTSPSPITADGSGSFSNVTFSIPDGATVGPHTVSAGDASRNIAGSPINVETVGISPTTGNATDPLTVSGQGWPQGDTIRIQIGGVTVCELPADSAGNVSGDAGDGCRVPSDVASGNQPVTAVDTDSSSREGTATNEFNILGPTASFTASPTTVQTGQQVNFNGSGSTNATSYSWNFGDGGTSTSSQPSHTYATPQTYQVTLIVKDAYGDKSTPASRSITVNPSPVTAAFNPAGGTYLAGQSVGFDGTPSSDPNGGSTLSYSWNFGDYGTASGPQPYHTFQMPGTYTVSLNVSDNYGQGSTITHQITVIAPPPLQTIILTPVAKPTIVRGGHVSATKSGIIDLGERLFCPGPGPHCVAYILASSTSLLHFADVARVRHKAIAATVAIPIKPNGSAEVKFQLNRRAFAYLHKKHRLPIKVKITLTRGQLTTTGVVSLVFVLR